MTINCLIIDDNPDFIAQVKCEINNWCQSKDCTANFCRDNYVEYDHTLEDIDIIFLDIDLHAAQNGISVAQKLRKNFYTGLIVFVTSYKEYVFDAYKVDALDYIVKPLSKEKLDFCMSRLISSTQKKYFVYKRRDEITQIPNDHILYFQSNGHKSDIVLENGDIISISQPFKALENDLAECFVRCHRTIYVNINKISSLNSKEILLSTGERLPVGAIYIESLKYCYLSWYS